MTTNGSFVFPDSPLADTSGTPIVAVDKLSGIIVQNKETFLVHPFSVGVYGGWGSGKTSVMQSLSNKLAKHMDIIQVWFNAWRYQHEKEIYKALYMEISHVIKELSVDHKAKETANLFAEPVNNVEAAFYSFFRRRTVDIDAQDFSFKGIKIKSNYYQRMRNIAETLAKDKVLLIIYVDDLDRCSPDTALATLEALKLFFDVGGFVFVVGVDDAVISQIIDERYRNWSTNPDNGREVKNNQIRGTNYLEKIFSLTIRADSYQPSKTLKAVKQHVECWLNTIKEDADLAKKSPLKEILEHAQWLFCDRALNPRELKRFVNHCLLEYDHQDGRNGVNERRFARLVVDHHKQWHLVKDAVAEYGAIFWDTLRPNGSEGGVNLVLSNLDARLRQIPYSFLQYVEKERPGHVLVRNDAAANQDADAAKMLETAREAISLRVLLNRMNREKEGDARAGEFVKLAATIEQYLFELRKRSEEAFPEGYGLDRINESLELLQKEMTRFRQERPYIATEAFDQWLSRTDPRVGLLLKDMAKLIPAE